MNKNNSLIVSIPTYLKIKIDEAFQSTYSATDLSKIYFLVYKINKEGVYQVHIHNHAWMLSLRKDEPSNILSTLVTLGIIKLVSKHRAKEKSRSYQLNKAYDYKSTDCFRINYYEGQCKFPIWVSRYLADGGIVKAKEHSNYQKKAGDSKDLLISSLQERIKHLEAQLGIIEQSSDIKPLVSESVVLLKQPSVSVSAPIYNSDTSRMTLKVLTTCWKHFDVIKLEGEGVDKLNFGDVEIHSQSTDCIELKTHSGTRTFTINGNIYSKTHTSTLITV